MRVTTLLRLISSADFGSGGVMRTNRVIQLGGQSNEKMRHLKPCYTLAWSYTIRCRNFRRPECFPRLQQISSQH